MKKIVFNRDNKFDIQLSDALVNERHLAEIFTAAKIEKIELKSETWQWEQTGNIAIEYACDGEPSGIATTEADRRDAGLSALSDRALESARPRSVSTRQVSQKWRR